MCIKKAASGGRFVGWGERCPANPNKAGDFVHSVPSGLRYCLQFVGWGKRRPANPNKADDSVRSVPSGLRYCLRFVGWGKRRPANPNKAVNFVHSALSGSRYSYAGLRPAGFTLIEMIVVIVVISIVAVGLLGVFTTSVARSADPMLRIQAVAIAQGYLDEALLKAYSDPDQAETGNCEAGEGRATYDDVQDYDCVNDVAGALDQFGNTLLGLDAYNVDMDVGPEVINGATLQRIDVMVTHDSLGAADITLTGYRADY